MTIETLENEVRELRRRPDLTETRLSQVEGRFEFISGQLRDVQLYQTAKFTSIDERFDGVEKRLDTLTSEVRALPRAIAEMIANPKS